jgi:uncharacterized protein
MRRKEREVLDPEFGRQVLREAQEMYVAFNTGEAPYLLPVNHVLCGDYLYFHCAVAGRKLELMGKDPRVGFSTAVDIRVENTTTRYRSVCGTGIATWIDDPQLKHEVLRAIAERFQAPCSFPVPEEKFARTGVVRIEIQTLTAKHSRSGEGPRTV